MLTFMTKRYPYLHKVDNLCIDLKDKTIECEINDKQEPILKFHTGKSTKYVLNDETLDKFNDIIMNRCNEEIDVTQCIQTMIESKSKEMKSKISETQIEMKSNMKSLNNNNDELNAKLDKQNQELFELKQMIHKLIEKNSGIRD